MCKKVGEIDGIAQYEFCEEYKKAKAELDKWVERRNWAEYEVRTRGEQVKKIQRTHNPL